MSLYAELKDWQGGIAALLGFLALMAAALWNFHLNRKRDSALRHEEMISVAVALYGEILLLREELAKVARIAAQYEVRQGEVPTRFASDYSPPEPILYSALAHKLGLLPSAMVIAITKFHGSYREAKESLPLICRENEIKYSMLALLRPAVDGVEDITPALTQIEKLAGLPEAKLPDMGYATTLLEQEELRFKE